MGPRPAGRGEGGVVTIEVSSTCVPFLERDGVPAADGPAEMVRIPFSSAVPNLFRQIPAPRRLQPTGSSGERIDRLVAVGRGHRIENLTL